MRPYLAIVVDSFREALASRVLWVLLIGITLVLAALAPLGYKSELTTDFVSNSDLFAPRELAGKLRQGRLPLPSPARAIWRVLEDKQRALIEDAAQSESGSLVEQARGLRRALNHAIDDEDLYQERDWRRARVIPAAGELLQRRDSLTEQQQRRLNRLLIEGAFPQHFRLRPDETITFTYLWLSFPRTVLDKRRMQTIIKEVALPLLMNFLLGVVAVLVALLVTSPIIPQMFEPGSLHLLLSKPLSRSLIFLSRFLGGCVFILLNVIYLQLGLWLILGVRFEIWNAGLLKCIPVFLFLFMVYYSVAALAGALWKNAIVSVGVAIGLWGVCFLLGVAKAQLGPAANDARLRKIIPAGERLLAVDEGSEELLLWNDEDGEWEEVFEGSGRLVDGPHYLVEADLIVASSGGRAPYFAQGQRTKTLVVGRPQDGWTRESRGSLPPGSAGLLPLGEDSLLAVARQGLFRLRSSLKPAEPPPKLLGLVPLQMPMIGSDFAAAGAGDFVWQPPLRAAAAGGDVYLYHRGRVMRFANGENELYRLQAQRTLDANPEDAAAICCAAGRVVVVIADGRVITLAADDLQVVREQRPVRGSQPRFLRASPDGQWLGVLYQDGHLWLARGDQPLQHPPLPGQGRLTTAALTDRSLLVCDSIRSVAEYSLPELQLRRRYEPPPNTLQTIYFVAVRPLSYVLPLPGELNQTAAYLLTGKRSTDAGMIQGTLDAPHGRIDPWQPVLRCSAFIAVMLALGCLYIERQEF